MKTNKFIYVHVLQGDYGYGYGYEDLTQSCNRMEVREDLRCYQSNEGGNYRIIQRREPNPEYKELAV